MTLGQLRVRVVAATIAWSLPLTSTTRGVDQDERSSRVLRQTSAPVFLSRPTMKEPAS